MARSRDGEDSVCAWTRRAGRVGDQAGARSRSESAARGDGADAEVCHWPSPGVGGWGAPVAESVLAPPGPIPNPVVTQRSAGEYCGGDPREARPPRTPPTPRPDRPASRSRDAARRLAVDTHQLQPKHPTRGGAAAARWAHNPKVGGSNPPPATTANAGTYQVPALLFVSAVESCFNVA